MVTQIQLGNLFQSGGRNVITGGASGLDIENLVKGLAEARRQPAVILEKNVESNGKRSEALGELKKILEDFKDASNFLRNPPGVRNASSNAFSFRQGTVTTNAGVSGSLYMNVTAEAGAPVGEFDLQINQLASRNIQTTGTFIVSDPNAAYIGTVGSAFNAGTLLVGPNSTPVNISNGDSITTMVSKINAVKQQSGVEATLLRLSGTDYRISFKSIETGTAQNYNLATLNPGFFNVGFAQQTNAVDAQIVLDGTTVTRSGNSISDLVSGLTFNLLATTPPATDLNVSIGADTELARAAIVNFVDAYNAFRLFAARQSELGSNGRPLETSILSSSRALTTPLAELSSELSRAVGGIDLGDPSSLADIGITFADFPGDQETPFTRNILQIDEEKLSSALQSNYDAVRKVFEFDVTTDDPNLTVFSRTNGLAVSDFTVDINTTTNNYTATFTIGGVPQTINLTRQSLGGNNFSLRAAQGSPLEGLVMLYTGTGTFSINVNITQGIGDRAFNALEEMLDEETGVIATEISQLEEQSQRYEEEITRIDAQVERYRDRMLAQFSALEQTISQINTLLQSLDAQANARNNS